MGDKVTSEQVVGEPVIGCLNLRVVRSTWRDHPGLSFDVYDKDTGELLTMNESFDDYPTDEQLRAVAEL